MDNLPDRVVQTPRGGPYARIPPEEAPLVVKRAEYIAGTIGDAIRRFGTRTESLSVHVIGMTVSWGYTVPHSDSLGPLRISISAVAPTARDVYALQTLHQMGLLSFPTHVQPSGFGSHVTCDVTDAGVAFFSECRLPERGLRRWVRGLIHRGPAPSPGARGGLRELGR